MEISNYGVTLRRLTEDKIEMIRNWRNDPKIAQYMEYKEYISPEMQKKWFDKINNDNNYYFLIVVDNKEIGLINIRDIDYEKREGEGGIYIYDDEYLNSDISFRSVLLLFDFGFEKLGLEQITAHVLKSNKRAIKYNIAIGYQIVNYNDLNENQLYVLTKENFNNKKIIINQFVN